MIAYNFGSCLFFYVIGKSSILRRLNLKPDEISHHLLRFISKDLAFLFLFGRTDTGNNFIKMN